MENFKTNLADLLKVKTLVTLIVVGVFAALAMTGKIEPDAVTNITLIVVGFYFGTQHEKKVAKTLDTPPKTSETEEGTETEVA